MLARWLPPSILYRTVPIALAMLACRDPITSCLYSTALTPPVFMVREVNDAVSGVPIRVVYIRSSGPIGWTGAPTPYFLGSLGPGATADGDQVRCEVVCLFGIEDADYSMRFAAPGYRDTTLLVQVRYTHAEGPPSCITRVWGPTVLRLRMRPA